MDAHRAQRVRDRDAALRRLRSLTAMALTGAGVLVGGFAGLAAKAFPGRSGHTAPPPVTHTVAAVQRTTHAAAATPPPLVAVHAAAPSPAPAPSPSPAPAPTPAPPVVVSGGS
jgi:hypothetical protein